MNEITKKQRWVLVPCPDYDVPAMESWLEEQAMQGLFLSKDDGFFLGLACFETGNPKRVRYRLDAVPKEKAFSEFDEKKQAHRAGRRDGLGVCRGMEGVSDLPLR